MAFTPGFNWRSDTDTSIQLGEAVALSYLQDRAHTYNEKFKRVADQGGRNHGHHINP